MKVQRFDRGSLGKPKELPNGFLRVDSYLTRVGVFEYRDAAGGVRRELRLPEEVFNEDSLDTLRMTALTMGHPARPVTAENARGLAVGTVGQDARREDEKVRATITVTDAESIAKMKRGTRQLSCGYWCELEMTGGVTSNVDGLPDGLEYDAIQRGIVYNHVAVVPRGRAGPDVAARLDAADGADVAVWHGAAEQVVDDADEDAPVGAPTIERGDSALAFEIWMRARDKGLTLGELATAAGVGLNEMESILGGGVVLTSSQIEGLADLLDTSAAALKDLLNDRQREQLDGEEEMKFKLTIDGVPHEYEGSESAQAAVTQALARAVDAITAEKSRADAAEEKRTEDAKAHADALAQAQAKADAAEEKAAELQAKLDAAASPEAIADAVKARVALEATAAKIVGEKFDAEGKSDTEIMREVVLAVSPSAEEKLDANDSAYLLARFDQAVEGFVARADAEDNIGKASAQRARAAATGALPNGKTGQPLGSRVDEARKAAQERNAKMWQQPLAASKDTTANA